MDVEIPQELLDMGEALETRWLAATRRPAVAEQLALIRDSAGYVDLLTALPFGRALLAEVASLMLAEMEFRQKKSEWLSRI